MLLRKIATTVTTEIKWGRLAAIAAGAALLAVVTSGGTLSFLSMVVFSLGGILIERVAPKRPYWNALAYGLLGLFFYTLLFELSNVGRGQPWPTTAVLLQEVLSVSIVVIPQALIGTWIGVTIRHFSQTSRQNKEKGDSPAQPEGANPEKEKGPKGARPASREPAGRRQGKR